MANLFDSANYPTVEPDELNAGDQWAWKRDDLGTDYDNTLFTLTYSARLEGVSGQDSEEIEMTATASGSGFLVEVASATTLGYTPGNWYWQAYMTRDADSERKVVDQGIFEVLPSRNTNKDDPRSQVKRTLDAINAMIEGTASKDQQSYTINGRTLARRTIDDLVKLQSVYEAKYQKEIAAIKLKSGEADPRKVQVVFNK